MNPDLKSTTPIASCLLARSLMGVRIWLMISAAMLLNACGGGGGAEVISSNQITISGRVIDGYIRGATVFWDCNNNTTLDAGEKSTITTQGGSYLIAPAPSANCDLLAHVPASAIDEDNPTGPIGYTYTMAAVTGKSDIISPLTTLVMGKLKSGEATSVQAGDGLIASQFGLSGSVLIDYKASTPNEISKSLAAIAKLAAKELSNITSGTPLIQITTPANANLTVANSTPGFNSTLKMGVVPYISKPDPVARLFKDWGVKPSADNIVLRNKFDVNNNTLIDTIAETLTQFQAAEYGVVDFWKLSETQMEPWTRQFSVPADRATRVNTLQQARIANFNAASSAWNTTIVDDIGFLNYIKNNPKAAADFALDIGSNTVDIIIDTVSIASAGAPAALRDNLIAITKTKRRLEQIQSVKSYLKDSNSCLTKTEGIFIEIEKSNSSSDAIRQQLPGVFVACKDLLGNILKDAKAISLLTKSKINIAALKASGKLLVVEKDLYALQNGQTTDSITVANLKVLKQLTEAYKDLLSVVMVPGPLATASAGVDLVIQYLDAYITGAEFGDAVIASNAALSASAEQLYIDEISKLYQKYHASFWTLFSDYFKVVNTKTDSYVRSITWSGGQMTLDHPTLITVTGGNFSNNAVLTIEGGTCLAPSSRGIGSFTAMCTVNTDAGLKKFTVLTDSSANSGAVISDVFAVDVVGITCAAPQLLINGLCVSPMISNVTNVSPTTATVSTATTFTITGQNLPLTAVMALAEGTCQTPTARTATGFTVVCTPGSTAGSKLVTISTATGGTVIDATRSVTVSLVCTAPQVLTNGVCVMPTTTAIPLAVSSWRLWILDPFYYAPPGPSVFEETVEGLKFYESVPRGGSEIFTNSNYSFANKTLYAKLKFDGKGSFGWAGIGISFSCTTEPCVSEPLVVLSTHNPYNGSILISDNTWYFVRSVISSSGFTSVTATGNYDDQGGSIVQTYSKAFSAYSNMGKPTVYFGDTYAPTVTTVLGELLIK